MKYHGSTGPMPAFIWPPGSDVWKEKQNDACIQSIKSGYIEPVDLNTGTAGGSVDDRDKFVTLLD